MKNSVTRFFLILMVFSMPTILFAEKTSWEKKQATKKKSFTKAEAERCRRAQGSAELSINNVRTRINTGGNMWYDGSSAQYFIPKDGNSTSLYCAALWIGGFDENNQLRVAAMRFGEAGDDFWPGPLTVDSANTEATVCNAFDRVYKINKADVELFRSMCADDPQGRGGEYNGEFIGEDASLVPDVIKQWPAHPKSDGYVGYSKYLAPFMDVNGDGIYDWTKGDYPYYDFENKLCPKTIKANGGVYKPTPTFESDPQWMTDEEPIKNGLLVDQVLKGDQTLWWVFNDKGSTHTESKGEPIGLEIRAQAFAFSTNDEINNMTFYSYEIVNRSAYTLKQTYFSQWVDPDLGYAKDDYVGCDVERGLGYCYNGKAIDGPGTGAYTGNPPAVGIDFFQGPYMDPDGKDNPKYDYEKMWRVAEVKVLLELPTAEGGYGVYDSVTGLFAALDTVKLTDDAHKFKTYWYFKENDSVGNCAINGVNFGNGIIDDERFGMRRFVYYNNDPNGINGEPSIAKHYHNYLRGFWRNDQRMTYGGPGYGKSSVECDFMFPGTTDIWKWGTNGKDIPAEYVEGRGWTEETSGNQPGDRRFMQSAGPFTLEPGAVNYITVGIPWAQASSGGPYASVELLKQVDDKCQALFDNCFKLVDGPDAPSLTISPLTNKLVLYLSYENENSNNYTENYAEQDLTIEREYISGYTYTDSVRYIIDSNYSSPDSIYWTYKETPVTDTNDRWYRFEGYEIYQLRDKTVSVSDIGNTDLVRLVAQCDIENYHPVTNSAISTLTNYERDNSTGGLTGKVMVSGANTGIRHSFEITEDLFAGGSNKNLVNNKEYYFIAVAYAYNNFKTYNQSDPNSLDGQKTQYLRGRRDQFGSEIKAVKGIPADPSARDGGTIVQSKYGDSPEITRIEGHGNGGLKVNLKQSSIDEVFNNNGTVVPLIEYEKNAGPLNVRIVDPLNVRPGEYHLKLLGTDDDSHWVLKKTDGAPLYYIKETTDGIEYLYENNNSSLERVDSIISRVPISQYSEQLVLPLGISVAIRQPKPTATSSDYRQGGYAKNGGNVDKGVFLGSEISFADPMKYWLGGFYDQDGDAAQNWIRSGAQFPSRALILNYNDGEELSDGELESFHSQDYYVSERPLGAHKDAIPADIVAIDEEQQFEKVLDGLWAPYKLVSTNSIHPGFSLQYYVNPNIPNSADYRKVFMGVRNPSENVSLMFNDLNNLASTQLVITPDKSKWTRCPVIEMCEDPNHSEGGKRRFQLRHGLSINKDGSYATEGSGSSDNPADPNFISERGMGWFPGYAINLETGERLNIVFGEDSRYSDDKGNGKDMKWNPTITGVDRETIKVDDKDSIIDHYIFGGKHYIYIVGSNNFNFPNLGTTDDRDNVPGNYTSPAYDEGRWAYKLLRTLDDLAQESNLISSLPIVDQYSRLRDSAQMVFANVMWVSMPRVAEQYMFKEQSDIPCDVTMRFYTRTTYKKNYTNKGDAAGSPLNDNNPMYTFKFTDDIITLKNVGGKDDARLTKNALLDKIAVVPNPYYNRSDYELDDRIQTQVKITNLLAGSVVSIYSLDGTLVRRLDPCPPSRTYMTWDMLNHVGQQISGGLYLFHINVPGIGETVIRWFGSMRPADINLYPID